jgi:hypothetical protein
MKKCRVSQTEQTAHQSSAHFDECSQRLVSQVVGTSGDTERVGNSFLIREKAGQGKVGDTPTRLTAHGNSRMYLLDLIPSRALRDLRDIVDILQNTAVEIYEAKQKALAEGDQETMISNMTSGLSY